MSDIREVARANLALVNASDHRTQKRHEEIMLRGFLATFHPELSKAEVRELVKGQP